MYRSTIAKIIYCPGAPKAERESERESEREREKQEHEGG